MARGIMQAMKEPAESTSVFSVLDNAEPVLWQTEVEDDGPLAGLTDAIESGYKNYNSEPRYSKKTSFAPSTLVWNHGICPRFWYLAFDGAMFYSDNTGKQITNMDSGSDRHARIQEALKQAGILIDNERETIVADPPIRGFVDSFINWKEVEYVVEIKTANQEAFDRHKRSRTASNYHILQLLIYMKIYKKKNGILLYENKNTHELLAIPVNITQKHVDFIDYLFGWMREVRKAWEDRNLPEVPFRSNNVKVCQNCPLQRACKEAPVGDIKIARRKDDKGAF